MALRGASDHAPKGQHDAKGTGLAVQTVGPLTGQFILDRREPEVTCGQTQARLDFLSGGWLNVTRPLQQGTESRVHGGGRVPKPFENLFVDNHGGEIGLGIQINGKHREAHAPVGPRQVVHQRGLARAIHGVEERDGFYGAGRSVAATQVGSRRNLGGGLPFCSKARLARGIPMPNRWA